jgi:hypothetical protein
VWWMACKVPTTYLTKFLKMMSYLGLPWSHEFLTMAWGRGVWIILLKVTRRCEAKHNHVHECSKSVWHIANGLELAASDKHAHTSWKLGLYGPSWEQWSLFAQKKCFEIKAKTPEKINHLVGAHIYCTFILVLIMWLEHKSMASYKKEGGLQVDS